MRPRLTPRTLYTNRMKLRGLLNFSTSDVGLLKVIPIPDYSNGGDVIIADTRIGNMLGLKGKRIGCEVSSLGIYILQP
jgi:hypothetical protein